MLKCLKFAKTGTFRKVSEIGKKCVRSGRTPSTVRVGRTCGGDCPNFCRALPGQRGGLCYSAGAENYFQRRGKYPPVKEGSRCRYAAPSKLPPLTYF